MGDGFVVFCVNAYLMGDHDAKLYCHTIGASYVSKVIHDFIGIESTW